jgi:hypothetical protein
VREHIITKFIWAFMAFFLLNLSIDTPAPAEASYEAQLGFNDQESIIELVLEKMVGIEDAIAERDDEEGSGDKESHLTAKIKLLLFSSLNWISPQYDFSYKKTQFPIFIGHESTGRIEKDAPPPEA